MNAEDHSSSVPAILSFPAMHSSTETGGFASNSRDSSKSIRFIIRNVLEFCWQIVVYSCLVETLLSENTILPLVGREQTSSLRELVELRSLASTIHKQNAAPNVSMYLHWNIWRNLWMINNTFEFEILPWFFGACSTAAVVPLSRSFMSTLNRSKSKSELAFVCDRIKCGDGWRVTGDGQWAS